MRSRRLPFVSTLALLTALLSAGCGGPDVEALENEAGKPVGRDLAQENDEPEQAPLDAPEVGGATLGAIPAVAERVVSSVVNIAALRHQRVPSREQHPLYSDPLFRHFFGAPGRAPPEERLERSLGSGVIVEGGVILTNNHVVAGADEVLVSLTDGRDLKADVVGNDPASDLAVLRLQGEPDGIEPLRIGSSSRLRLGQTVLAIGNPFGIGQTITMGIVSATGRSGIGIVDYENFIQTDAAINPGNSGGALVNLKGELVGINTAILSRSGGYQGIGFAIPSDMVKLVMDDLLDDGVVDRGFLGVQIQDLSSEQAAALRLGKTRGALVARVMPGSPAERAGLEPGDVVVAVDGRQVSSAQDLKNIVGLKGAGVNVEMIVLRGDEKREASIVLGAQRQNDGATRRR